MPAACCCCCCCYCSVILLSGLVLLLLPLFLLNNRAGGFYRSCEQLLLGWFSALEKYYRTAHPTASPAEPGELARLAAFSLGFLKRLYIGERWEACQLFAFILQKPWLLYCARPRILPSYELLFLPKTPGSSVGREIEFLSIFIYSMYSQILNIICEWKNYYCFYASNRYILSYFVA